jgi:imidazolonepropionase-like amidohydrolase
MKTASIALVICLFWLPSAARTAAPPAHKHVASVSSRVLAIVGVTVISCADEPPRANTTVLIQDGRIIAIGGAVAVPAGARKLDGRDKYLIPGLWDMHVHVTHDQFRTLFLAHGITGIRHMFSFSRWSSPRHWRTPAKQPLVAPRLVLSDSMLDGHRPALPLLLRANVYRAKDARSARKEVKAFKTRQEDFVKVYPCLSREAFLAVLDEARKQGLPVAGHVPHAINVGEAADKGMHSIEHLSGVALACSRNEQTLRMALVRDMETVLKGMDAATAWRTQVQAYRSYDAAKASKLFRLFVRTGAWHVPTLVQKRAWGDLANAGFTNDPRLPSLPGMVRTLWKVERTREGVRLPLAGVTFTFSELREHRWQFRKDLEVVEAMHNAGVRLLAGTDTPSPCCFPGSGLHDELELLVEAGLSPLAALQTATRNPALFLGRRKDLGTVEVGKLADLVLLEADPLKYIGNTRRIAAVVFAGQVIDPRKLHPKADPTKKGNETSRRSSVTLKRLAG